MTTRQKRDQKQVAPIEPVVEEEDVAIEEVTPRTLKVINNYVGSLTGEAYINTGTYQEDDPALFGLGEYLVETIHDAVWV